MNGRSGKIRITRVRRVAIRTPEGATPIPRVSTRTHPGEISTYSTVPSGRRPTKPSGSPPTATTIRRPTGTSGNPASRPQTGTSGHQSTATTGLRLTATNGSLTIRPLTATSGHQSTGTSGSLPTATSIRRPTGTSGSRSTVTGILGRSLRFIHGRRASTVRQDPRGSPSRVHARTLKHMVIVS
jgi:hypothetical protein